VSVTYAIPLRVSVLADRSLSLVEQGVHSTITFAEEPITLRDSPRVPVTFYPQAAERLLDRPDGVRIYYDGMAAVSIARTITKYFRLVEAAFGMSGSRLERSKLFDFLKDGPVPVSLSEWEKIRDMRNYLNHAYRAGKIAYEDDANVLFDLMEGIAGDLLVNVPSRTIT
jgi:hypothetical protein